MTARRSRTVLRHTLTSGRFTVVCRRYDGRERIWQHYDDRSECERVAAHLTKIGCPSRCTSEDELALEEVAEK
jgi:hypothetical protein